MTHDGCRRFVAQGPDFENNRILRPKISETQWIQGSGECAGGTENHNEGGSRDLPNPPRSGVSKVMNTGNSEFAAGGSYMTFEQVLAELQIARSTLDGWRRKRLFPAFTRLPNGQLRLKRIDFTAWVNKQRKAA